MSDPPDERRTADRHAVFTSAELETEGGDVRVAITEDVSERGLLLLTRARLDVGDPVRVRIHVTGEEKPAVVSGRVVRRTPLEPGASPIWTQEIAVALDEPAPAVAALREARRAGQPPSGAA